MGAKVSAIPLRATRYDGPGAEGMRFSCAVSSSMRTLKMDGTEKVLMGVADLKQVRSVCIK